MPDPDRSPIRDDAVRPAPGGTHDDATMRILIVRLSAIGDTIHSIPLAAALRKAFPSAFIGWVTEKPSATLIEGNPLLDWSYVLPKGWLKSPRQVFQLRRALRRQRFDFAFDPQGLTKSAAAAWLSGAPRRIGFTRGESRELAPFLDNLLIAPKGRHAVDMTLSLLSGIGLAPPARATFVLPPCPADDASRIDDFLPLELAAKGYVLMGPWGSFKSKLWPLDRYLTLAIRLKGDSGLTSVMLGHGEREREQVVELVRKSAGALLPAPDVSPAGVAELARRARLFVGIDSFPMHASAAVGCRTLGLFGVTDPWRLGPYGPGSRVVFKHITLVRSTRERRRLGPENLEALGVERVLETCLDMLGEGNRHDSPGKR